MSTCSARLWLETPAEPDGFYIYCEKAPDHDPSQAHGTLDGYAWSVPVASSVSYTHLRAHET